MSEEYSVGYKKPPLEHRFKRGNQAAKGRKRKTATGLSIPEIIAKALATKRRIKRGDDVIEMPVAEILAERLVQAMTTGSPKDMALMMGLLERYSPQALAGQPEALEVRYHRAEGSTVNLPPADLWEERKP